MDCLMPWPANVTYTFSGVANSSGCGVCCYFDPPGPAGCINRTFIVPPDGVPDFRACGIAYSQDCQTVDGSFNAATVETVVTFVANFVTETVSVRLGISAVYFDEFGVGQGPICPGSRLYAKEYPLASFPCDGPWTLDDTGTPVCRQHQLPDRLARHRDGQRHVLCPHVAVLRRPDR
jgi:hypothetical protein